MRRALAVLVVLSALLGGCRGRTIINNYTLPPTNSAPSPAPATPTPTPTPTPTATPSPTPAPTATPKKH